MECPNCDYDIEPDEFPFGREVKCPNCNKIWKTDWDYTDAYEGSMAWWIIEDD